MIPGLGRSTGEGIGYPLQYSLGFPGVSVGKESTCKAGDLALISWLRISPGEGKGYPLQYSGLENSMDCIVCGVTESDNTEQLDIKFIIQNQNYICTKVINKVNKYRCIMIYLQTHIIHEYISIIHMPYTD